MAGLETLDTGTTQANANDKKTQNRVNSSE